MEVSTNTGLHSARSGQERYTPAETIAFLADIGFRVLDFNFSGAIYANPPKVDRTLLSPDWRRTIENMRNDLEKRGMVVKYSHLPWYRFDEPETPDLEFKLEMTLRALEASALLGVEWAVIHPSRSENPEKAEEASVRYIETLLDPALKCGVGIAIENMAFPEETYNNAEALCALIDRFGDHVGICWDTGHANMSKIDQVANIRQLGTRIKMLHVHDNFGIKDEHRPPYMGNIKWPQVMQALASAGFSGDLNFEVSATRLPENLRPSFANYVYETGLYLCGLFHEYTGKSH